jgi:hypothetical protein
MLTQDCAALVLGYYPLSLREKDRCRFHQSRVGFAGGRLKRNRNASSTKQGVVMEFYGLPPIGQKQRRPMDGAPSFIPRGSAKTMDD